MINESTFPIEPWHVRETTLDLDLLAQSESVFALSNGHIGLRGNLDEGEPHGFPGTYLNSFFEMRPLPYAEAGYGYPEEGETIVDVTNGKILRLLVDDEPFDVRYGELQHHERVLDLRAGTLTRTVRWRSPAGRWINLTTTRIVSLAQRGVAAIEYVVEAVDEFTRVTVQSELVANEDQPETSNDPRASALLTSPLTPVTHEWGQQSAVLIHRTRVSELMMAAAMDHDVEVPGRVEVETTARDDLARTTVICGLRPGQKLRIVKYLGYGWSSLRSRPALRDQVAGALTAARYMGWQGLLDAQREYLDEFWDSADVEVEGDPACQQAVRFGLFHVLQASARAERRAIPGKGLTGTGYDGHAFWDTEGYVLPVLTYTHPDAAADALRWRASTLDLARQRAKELDFRGASFPWRTIRGQECSAYWPAGTAAWHVNADIAAAFERYRVVTGDESLEADCGLEVLVETARLWHSLGHHDRNGVWHIDGVTGPDEYTAVVRDNVFTNLMAANNLRIAAAACRRHPDAAWAMDVTTEEMAGWHDAADAVHIPYDDGLGVHQQCDGFTTLREWDFDDDTEYPLLLQPALRPALSGAGHQASRPGVGHALAGPCVHPGAEGAQRRLLRAPNGAGLLVVGVHAGGAVRRGRTSGAGPRLRPRGGAHRPARPAPRHAQRTAHGVAGRGVDGASGRLRRVTRRRGLPGARSAAARGPHSAVLSAALARFPRHGRHRPRRGHLHAARRTRRRTDHPARRRGTAAVHPRAVDGETTSPPGCAPRSATAQGPRAHPSSALKGMWSRRLGIRGR